MSMLLSEIHFWSTQEDVIIKHTDYGSFKYYPKKEHSDSLYYQSKKKYAEQRGTGWHLPNKRPLKLRDKLKELEDHLLHNKIISFAWTDNQLQLLLSTGILVNIIVNIKTGDISSLTLDKQLATKLQVNILCDGAILGQQIICICNDGHVLGYGGLWKDGWIVEGGPRRHLNVHGDWLAVWGKAEAEHPQPWTPLGKDYQRANLHLYWIGARGAELLAYKKTDGDPIDVVVSKSTKRVLIVIEQKVTLRGSVSVEVSCLELVGSNLKRISVTSVPLQTQVSCCALSEKEDRLLIGCIDGSLALLDRNRGSTRTVKASFIPTFVQWHQNGAIVLISNERGQLQYFDTALNSLKSQLISDDCTPTALVDLSGYFNMQITITSISWGPKDLVLALEQGPIVVISHVDRSFNFKAIAGQYLRTDKVERAIGLLLSWEFNDESFRVLQRIVVHLLSHAMTDETAKYLQDALGSFHSPPVPLATDVRNRYGKQVYSLTRRFFHQLVRASMFEMAFLLAVDLGHHDLFMDLHYIAVKIGETEMAAAARAQASALLSRCSSEASNCSRSSCSQCSGDTNSTSEEEFMPSDYKDVANKKKALNAQYEASNSDNFLTTNFNQPFPKTYNNNVPSIPSIDLLPKLGVNASGSALSSSSSSRATYVKAPQVPASFIKPHNPQLVVVSAPPLPFTTSTNNNASCLNSNLGIPYLNTNLLFNSNRMTATTAFSTPSLNKLTTYPHNNNPVLLPPPPLRPHLSLSNINKNPFIIPPPTGSTTVIAPPLPRTSTATTSLDNNNHPPSMSYTGAIKKQQPKVKFSDTVTAFIVPEIKRPIRPPPPSHLTDPRKELADSLPLCHPNEDYLKDFTPIRKNDVGANEVAAVAPSSIGGPTTSNNSSQPKIKVVHFGVV